jgi:hypothetical protein
LDKNEPFYIGIGSDSEYKRANQLKNDRRNPIWHKIASKTEIEVEILLDDLSYEEAIAKEIEFIALYGRLNNATGILSNLTDGGEGTLGVVKSDELKKKMSIRMKHPDNPIFHLSEESKEKRRLKRVGKPTWNKGKKGIYTEEQLKKMSEIKKGKKAWNKGIPRTEEEKRKMSTGRLLKNIVAWNLGKKGVNGMGKAKIVLNLENGIFYESCKEAAKIYGYAHSTLKCKLNGNMKNNTCLIYA